MIAVFTAIMVCIACAGVIGVYMLVDDLQTHVRNLDFAVEALGRQIRNLEDDVNALADLVRLKDTLRGN